MCAELPGLGHDVDKCCVRNLMFQARTRAAHNLSRLFAPALCTLLQPRSTPGSPEEPRTGNGRARQALACMTMDAHSSSCAGVRVWPESVPNLRNEATAALPAAAVAAESKAEGAGIMPLNIVMIVRPRRPCSCTHFIYNVYALNTWW